MLATFAVGYHNKVLAVPLQWLSKVLLYSDDKQLTADLKHYKCQLNGTGDGVLFMRNSFDSQIDVVSATCKYALLRQVNVNVCFFSLADKTAPRTIRECVVC